MNRILSFCLLILFLISACYAAKRPDWTRIEPANKEYYYGISSVSKALPDYADIARDNALKNISLQITVQIKAELTTSETEITGINSNEFISSIQSSTSAILEDVELYQVYETKKEYWACWRLSKVKYRMMREARKVLAMSQAKDLLAKYDQPDTELSHGIGLLLSGLDLLESFVDLDLTTEYQDKRIQLFNELLFRLRGIPSDLQPEIVLDQADLVIKRALRTSYRVSLRGRDPQALRHFPLTAVFTRGEGSLVCEGFTNDKGFMTMFVDQITSFEPLQTVAVRIDKAHFLPGIKSEAVKSIWQSLVFKEAVLTINAIKPRIKLSYHADGESDEEAIKKVSGRMLELDLGLARDNAEAHYLLDVKVSTREGSFIEELGIWSAFADTRLSLTDLETGSVIYSDSYANLKGTGKTMSLALQRARQAAANQIVNEVLYTNVAKLIYR